MAISTIHFFSEDTDFKIRDKAKVREWIKVVCKDHGFTISELNFIFCSDAYLLPMNQQYLSHDTYTDVITFDNATGLGNTSRPRIVGDIFISVDRVAENAHAVRVPFAVELYRVMVHGTLHLLGFKDKSAKDKVRMTAEEDRFLALMPPATATF